MNWIFDPLERGKYGAILADPPWRFRTWDQRVAIPKARKGEISGTNTSAATHYDTMPIEELCALPVGELAATDCSLFLWCCWPNLLDALSAIEAWGFQYKTAGFVWTKAHAGQIDMFRDDFDTIMGMGYWTRANSEPCILATRGNPKRLDAGIRQAIIEPRRQHSRKPDCVHQRIERLVAGPYVELFARQRRSGWDCWGNQADRFKEVVVPQIELQRESWDEMWARPFDWDKFNGQESPIHQGACSGLNDPERRDQDLDH